MTLNLKGLADQWHERRSHAIVQSLRRQSLDVLCLQEATIRYGSPGFYDQAADLGDSLGLNYTIFTAYGNPIEVMSPEQGGIAILSRWPIKEGRIRKLPPGLSGPEDPPDSRVAILAEIEGPESLFRIINVHLSWRPEETSIRLVQAGLLIDTLSSGGGLDHSSKMIVAGDLNALEREPAIQLLSEHFIDSFRSLNPHDPGFTVFPSNPLTHGWKSPARRLDYIFCSRRARVKHSEVILNRPGTPFPSDHFGVLSEIEF